MSSTRHDGSPLWQGGMRAPGLPQLSSWLWLTAAVILVGVISALGAYRPSAPLPLDVTSAKPDGALAAYLWLERSGYRVRNETDPSLGLQRLRPAGDTFMILRPGDVSSRQANALLGWVRLGGRLVVAAQTGVDAGILAALGLRVRQADPGIVQVEQPLLLAPPVGRLYGLASDIIQAGSSDIPIASTGEGPILLSRRQGLGQVWLLSTPLLLENDHIARADNRRLLLNLAGAPGAAVAFDQAGPGAKPSGSPSSWLTGTNWGVALIFAVLVLLLFRWLSGLRLGPAVVAVHQSHRPAAEYVVSMAGLLRRGRKRSEVLERYQQSLRRTLHSRFGTDRPDHLDTRQQERLQSLLARRPRLSEDELLRRSAKIVEYEEELRRSRV